MPVTAAQRLKGAINQHTSGGKPERVVELARACGVDGLIGRRAARGITINAGDYLKLCAACGIDPMTGADAPVRQLTDLDWGRVAIKILLRIIGNPGDKKITMRALAKQCRVSLVALCRMKAGHHVGVDNLLRLCHGLSCHPHDFLTPKRPVFHGEQPVGHVEKIEVEA